jgi:hypothetical protein
MRRDEILRLLREQPFRPFRLRLTNGITHDIRHPDMAIVTPSAVYVGVPGAGAAIDAADDIVVVSFLHVVQIEYLAPPAASATPSQPTSS